MLQLWGLVHNKIESLKQVGTYVSQYINMQLTVRETLSCKGESENESICSRLYAYSAVDSMNLISRYLYTCQRSSSTHKFDSRCVSDHSTMQAVLLTRCRTFLVLLGACKS